MLRSRFRRSAEGHSGQMNFGSTALASFARPIGSRSERAQCVVWILFNFVVFLARTHECTSGRTIYRRPARPNDLWHVSVGSNISSTGIFIIYCGASSGYYYYCDAMAIARLQTHSVCRLPPPSLLLPLPLHTHESNI